MTSPEELGSSWASSAQFREWLPLAQLTKFALAQAGPAGRVDPRFGLAAEVVVVVPQKIHDSTINANPLKY